MHLNALSPMLLLQFSETENTQINMDVLAEFG
jgi:hypothetical protein